jgi:hypothetical protein
MYIYNDKSPFFSIELYNATLATRDSGTKVIGKGTMKLIGRVSQTSKRRKIILIDALFSRFHTNLVSYLKLRKKGAIWCQQTDWIIDSMGNAVVSTHLWDDIGLWVFDEPEEVFYVHAVRSSEKPHEARASLVSPGNLQLTMPKPKIYYEIAQPSKSKHSSAVLKKLRYKVLEHGGICGPAKTREKTIQSWAYAGSI